MVQYVMPNDISDKHPEGVPQKYLEDALIRFYKKVPETFKK